MKPHHMAAIAVLVPLALACGDRKYEMTFRNQGMDPVDVNVVVHRPGAAPESIYASRVAPASDGYYLNTDVEGDDVRVEAQFTRPDMVGPPSSVWIRNKKRVVVELNTSAGTVFVARTYIDDDDDDDDAFDDHDDDDDDNEMDDYDDDFKYDYDDDDDDD